MREGIGMVFVKSKAMKIAVLPEQDVVDEGDCHEVNMVYRCG